MSNVIDLDTRRPCRVELVECRACGNVWLDALPMGADIHRRECAKCSSTNSKAAEQPGKREGA